MALVLACALVPASASAIDLIDPEAFHVNPEELPHVDLGEPSISDELKVNEDTLKAEDESLLDESLQEDRNELDWCLWSALAEMASEMASSEPPANVGEELEGHLLTCLKGHFEHKAEASSIPWVARAMALKSEVEVLEELGLEPEAAWDQLVEHGVTLSVDVWREGLEHAAAAVPPVP
ncbi:MAG TPA: hypothetical protein VL988_13165 [Solirubrobacteraceae bacterium]|nr:hypothetical protein [Solirubrobacteraceae bacterium]